MLQTKGHERAQKAQEGRSTADVLYKVMLGRRRIRFCLTDNVRVTEVTMKGE